MSSRVFRWILLLCVGCATPLPGQVEGLPGQGDGLQDEGPPIGVLLATDAKRIEITSEAGLRIEAETGKDVADRGVQVLSFVGDEARFAGHILRARPFRFCARRGEPTRVAGNPYEGWIEVLFDRTKSAEPRWRLVNRLPLERYLLGVLPNEMPASFPAQALRAQAVAARTYALYQIARSPEASRVHVTADVFSQVYRGWTGDERVRDAVEKTRGEVLLYEGRIFESYYHSTCGGWTNSATAAFGGPEIQALRPESCDACQDSEYYRWDCDLTPAVVSAVLEPLARSAGIALGTVSALEPVDVGPGGHAAYLRVVHAGGSFEVDAILLRIRLIERGIDELRSTAFTCQFRDGVFHFEGRGFGHGVGLCQYGARGLAARGSDHAQILSFYYPGIRVMQLWE